MEPLAGLIIPVFGRFIKIPESISEQVETMFLKGIMENI
jgi:hypothetical protein